MNPEEFAQKIKAKYPQYKDLDDQELVNRMLVKYPAYKDVVNMEQPERRGVLDFAGDAISGVVQSGLSTARGAGQLAQGFGQRALAAIDPTKTLDEVRDSTGLDVLKDDTEAGKKAVETLTPENTTEKVFQAGADIAQFAVPGGAATRAGANLTKAPTVGKMIAEGVTTLGVGSAQEGGVSKEVGDATIISTLFPVAGKAFKAGKTVIGPSAGSKVINSLIKPVSRDFSYGKNPGRAVASEGIVVKSLGELSEKLQETIQKRSDELNSLVSSYEGRFNVEPAIDVLNNALQKAVKQNNETLVKRIEKTRQAITENLVGRLDDGGNVTIVSTGPRVLNDMSASDVIKLKRDIGEITSFTGNPSDDKLVNSALKAVYGRIKGQLDEAIPGVKNKSEHLADLISARVATENRDAIVQRQNLMGFSAKQLTGAGGIVSLATMNPAPLILGLGAAGLEKALSTPKAKTQLASWLAKATPEQRKQLFQKAPWAKGIISRMIIGED